MEDNKEQIVDSIESEEIPADHVDGSIEEHHHHSSHSHHHHHKRKSAKRKKSKLLSFIKKHKSVLVNILSCTVSLVLLVVLAVTIDFSHPGDIKSDPVDVTKSTVKIETSVYPKEILLVSDAISYYMTGDSGESATEVYRSFDGYKVRLNEGLPLAFTYQVTGLPTGVEVKTVELEISENDDYSQARVYPMDSENASIEVYNLKTGTKYYYRVNLTLSDGCIVGTTGTFRTEESPRILHIDGIVNARDIGGWKTEDGKMIRQGLLYRGSELDGAVQSEYKITDRGLQQMIGELGVRFDMDLRAASENKEGTDALGKNVIHKYYEVGMYSDLLGSGYNENVRCVFSDLADPNNYPIYLHCTYGRDRTGSVCYILGALLGMSEEDLVREYELSAFTDSYVNTPAFNAFLERINYFEGGTTMQKVENYLLSVGVTAEEIASIRQIFLTE